MAFRQKNLDVRFIELNFLCKYFVCGNYILMVFILIISGLHRMYMYVHHIAFINGETI